MRPSPRVLPPLLFFCMAALLLTQCDLPQKNTMIPIGNGWRFHPGDSAAWAGTTYNDSAWVPIKIGQNWESQGYPDLDGFAWYRLHIIIPSSLKQNAFLKERLVIKLGRVDDGDELYLNDSLIGRNAGNGGKIETGNGSLQRSYTLALDDPRIHWDKENVV